MDKYNDWTVIDNTIIRKNGKQHVTCQCKCGLIKTVYVYALKSNQSKRCSSCAGKLIELNEGFKKSWKGNYEGELSGTMYSHIKSKARERKLDFLLSKKFLWKLLCEQEHKCALSGLPIQLSTSISKHNGPDFNYITASLDRIDSNKGYTQDNVQWVHKDVNRMKMQYDNQYFIDMCILIAQNVRPCAGQTSPKKAL